MGENRNTENIEENNLEENNVNDEKEETSNKGMPIRTYLVMAIAGAYVVYLGFSLCSGVVKGAEGSSIGFLVAGIAFIVLGGIFVARGLRGYLQVKKEQKEQASQTEKSIKNETVAEEIKESGKKMSIADRANLVKNMEESDGEVEQENIENPEE